MANLIHPKGHPDMKRCNFCTLCHVMLCFPRFVLYPSKGLDELYMYYGKAPFLSERTIFQSPE